MPTHIATHMFTHVYTHHHTHVHAHIYTRVCTYAYAQAKPHGLLLPPPDNERQLQAGLCLVPNHRLPHRHDWAPSQQRALPLSRPRLPRPQRGRAMTSTADRLPRGKAKQSLVSIAIRFATNARKAAGLFFREWPIERYLGFRKMAAVIDSSSAQSPIAIPPIAIPPIAIPISGRRPFVTAKPAARLSENVCHVFAGRVQGSRCRSSL